MELYYPTYLPPDDTVLAEDRPAAAQVFSYVNLTFSEERQTIGEQPYLESTSRLEHFAAAKEASSVAHDSEDEICMV